MSPGASGSLMVSVSPENGFRAFPLVRLLWTAERLGLQLCTLDAVGELAAEHEDDGERNQ